MGRYKSYRNREGRDDKDVDRPDGDSREDGARYSPPPIEPAMIRPRPQTPPAEPQPAAEEIEGTVKFYREDKGFGFIASAGGGKDVFVHASTLNRAGIPGLVPGQRVRMLVGEGPKGHEARSITLLD